MNRYFLEVSYIGTNYAGFQIQKNAVTIQSEIEKALQILLKKKISLTGSSRTDAGVHALQNYFHFDIDETLDRKLIYNINAILPDDISVNDLRPVKPESHCRFDAIARLYKYRVYWKKNPFLLDRAYYYPYKMDINKLQQAALLLYEYTDYTAFSKRRTQVQTYNCSIVENGWRVDEDQLIYAIKANRFLRGMVRGLVGTMLQVGKGNIQPEQFRKIIEERNSSMVNFSVPAKGLFLQEVFFSTDYFVF